MKMIKKEKNASKYIFIQNTISLNVYYYFIYFFNTNTRRDIFIDTYFLMIHKYQQCDKKTANNICLKLFQCINGNCFYAVIKQKACLVFYQKYLFRYTTLLLYHKGLIKFFELFIFFFNISLKSKAIILRKMPLKFYLLKNNAYSVYIRMCVYVTDTDRGVSKTKGFCQLWSFYNMHSF